MTKCIFCLSEKESFRTKEHIIPESLGGEEILPEGHVCDSCNQYFGTKVEKEALSIPVISFTRAWLSQRSKKGKHHSHQGYGFRMIGNDLGETLVRFSPRKYEAVLQKGGGVLRVPAIGFNVLARLLLKIGLELLALSPEYDVYSPQFDSARTIARFPPRGVTWPFGAAMLDPEAGVEAGEDNEGHYETRIIHQYNLWRESSSGCIMLAFAFGPDVFLTPLTEGLFPPTISIVEEKTGKEHNVVMKQIPIAE
jgi:hypothetical protein